MGAVTYLGSVLARAGQQRPEAGTEVRTREDGIEHQAREDEDHRKRGQEW